jgi:hypothetical protein
MSSDKKKPEDKDKPQRRVYVLPAELVDRIVEFQQKMGIGSEVEAARRLLDEALKHRDDARAITNRFQARLKETKIMSDITRDVLIGHPLLSSVSMDQSNMIKFSLKTGDRVVIYDNGRAEITNEYNETTSLTPGGLDDDIPF